MGTKAPPPKMTISEFLTSEKKLHELSRQELYDLGNTPDCPEFLKVNIAQEFTGRIR